MGTYRLEDFGGRGDGRFDNSSCFANAFAQLANTGGTLVVGSGTYLTGPLTIRGDEVHVILEDGCILLFLSDENLYTPVFTRWEGVNCYCMHPCVHVLDATNVSITGKGVIDGNGSWWWETANKKKHKQIGPVSVMEHTLAALNPGYLEQCGGGGGREAQFLRPPLLQIQNCKGVKLEGITLQNSPFWTLHPLYSSNLTIKGLKVLNPFDAPNTDGIDVDSCSNVTIADCLVDVGDDGIALKSGSGPDGIAVNMPTQNIVIEHCTVRSAHGGAVIGSETAAGIHEVSVSDCVFDGTDRGIRIKTRRGRGGNISKLHFDGVQMKNNLCPLTINMYYRCGSIDDQEFSLEKLPLNDTTPSISDILIENCMATDCLSTAGFIVGLPEAPVKNLVIKDCSFSIASSNLAPIDDSEMYAGLPEVTSRGVRLRNVELTVSNLAVGGVKEGMIIEDGAVIKQ